MARLAERDPPQAVAALLDGLVPQSSGYADWPAALAEDLLRNPALELGAWAHDHRLHRAALGRGFRRVFGITPAAFRATARARQAARLLWAPTSKLVDVADAAGFADQAHMTRAIVALTGMPPGRLRRMRAGGVGVDLPADRLGSRGD